MRQTPPFNVLVVDLIDLLRLEKKRLLQGELNELPKIAERKSYYVSILDTYLSEQNQRADIMAFSKEIDTISKLSAENAHLLTAAKNGVNAAKSRLDRIANREQTVGTYTENGYKLASHNAGITRNMTA